MIKQKRQNRVFKTPEKIKLLQQSSLSRRDFLWQLAVSTTGVALTGASCKKTEITPPKAQGHDAAVLSKDEWALLVAVQDILLPGEADSPGAREIGAAAFVQWIIADEQLDVADRKFLKDGLRWVNEEAVERWDRNFVDMKPENQDKLMRHIETYDWGETWLATMLLHIFEALLSDPLYGANSKESGWEWLQHNPGMPRPEKNKMYGNFKGLDEQKG